MTTEATRGTSSSDAYKHSAEDGDSTVAHDAADDPNDGQILRLLLVDNDPLAGDAIRLLLGRHGLDVVCVAAEVGSILQEVERHEPQVVVIDLYLAPGKPDGIQIASALKRSRSALPVVICTASESPADAARAWDAGIDCYLSKRHLLDRPQDTPTMLRRVLSGTVVYDVDPRIDQSGVGELSDREIEVVRFKSDGLSHRAIANELCIGIRTVDSHLANVKTKLRTSSIEEVLRLVAERRLVEPPDSP